MGDGRKDARAETLRALSRFLFMPSSVIRRYSYDPAHCRLDIDFVSGETYSYFGVPQTVVSGLKAALSKGRYFQRHIRDRFDYRRDRNRSPGAA